MAETILVRSDSAALGRKLRAAVGKYPRGVAAGINRTAQGAQTLAIREIQKDTGATAQKTIRANLSLKRASAEKTEAKIIAVSGKRDRIPIYELRPRPRTVTKRRPAIGVGYGPLSIKIPGSFIARMRSGHIGVFKRALERRLPVAELFGPSVALVFSRKKIMAAVGAYIKERLPLEIGKAVKALG